MVINLSKYTVFIIILFGMMLGVHMNADGFGLFSGGNSEEATLFNSRREVQSVDLDSFPKWTGVVARHMRDVGSGNQQLADWERRWWGLRGKATMDKLEQVNRTINGYKYTFDQKIWGQSDYWATPLELMTQKRGDCEDYAIAKYFALKEAGVPEKDMRLVVLKDTRMQILHAVLAVYVSGIPYILDNRHMAVLPSSSLGHYSPIYSINQHAWWRHVG